MADVQTTNKTISVSVSNPPVNITVSQPVNSVVVGGITEAQVVSTVNSAITSHTDTDTSSTAIHHTLGTGEFQAAQGNHTHSGYEPVGSALAVKDTTSVTGILKGNGSVISSASVLDFPTLNQNTTGTASNLSGTPLLPDGTSATTQTQNDNSTKLATTAYVDNSVSTNLSLHTTNTNNPHNTTAEQVGADLLGTASNLMTNHTSAINPHTQYTLESSLGTAAFTASTDYATASHNHSGVYEQANSNIQSHILSTSNPHSVTAGQVGADPSGTASAAISAHLSDSSNSHLSATDKTTLTTGVNADALHTHNYASTLDGLTDVTAPSPSKWDIITNDGAGNWVTKPGVPQESYTITTAVGAASTIRIATIPLSAANKNVTFKFTATTAAGTQTESTVSIDFAWRSDLNTSWVPGFTTLTSHSYNVLTTAENGWVCRYLYVSADPAAGYGYIDIYNYKAGTVTYVVTPLVANSWTWMTGVQGVSTIPALYGLTYFYAGLYGNAITATSAGSATYSNYGMYIGRTTSSSVDKTGQWAYFCNIVMTYNSTYRYGHVMNGEITLMEVGDNVTGGQNSDVVSVGIHAAMPVHADATAFNTAVPYLALDIEGQTSLTPSDFAILVYSTSTTAKDIRVYVKITGANKHYDLIQKSRYGTSYSSTLVATPSYCSYAAVAVGGTAALPTPGQGSVVNATYRQISINNIPTGTSGSTVALGDHSHTGVYEPSNANIQSHISNTSNPHSTTAAQVGADASGTASGIMSSHTGASDPHAQYALESTLGTAAYTASTDYSISGHTHSGTYEPANSNIQSHISSTSNPHGTTAAQVGADSSGTASGLMATHTSTYDHTKLHSQSHSITSGSDHTFPGGTSTFLRADGTFASVGSSLTPASTVTPERTLNNTASSVGTSVDYARADHTHGTPPMPTAANVGADPSGTASSAVTTHLADTANGHLSAAQKTALVTGVGADSYHTHANLTPSNSDATVYLPDASGFYGLTIRDSGGASVSRVNSDGAATFKSIAIDQEIYSYTAANAKLAFINAGGVQNGVMLSPWVLNSATGLVAFANSTSGSFDVSGSDYVRLNSTSNYRLTVASTAPFISMSSNAGVDSISLLMMGSSFGINYNFSTSLSGSPPPGVLSYNNAAPESVTAITLSSTNANGYSSSAMIDAITSACTIYISTADKQRFHAFSVTSVSGTTTKTINVSYLYGSGTSVTDGQPVVISFSVNSDHSHGQLHNRQHAITSTSDHTFPNDPGVFLCGDGTWTSPPPSGGGSGTSTGLAIGIAAKIYG